MNKMNKKGFTLIEMLVVIAIIAVLVSIIIPTVANSTKKASAAADAANLRSVLAEVTATYLTGNKSTDASGTTTITGNTAKLTVSAGKVTAIDIVDAKAPACKSDKTKALSISYVEGVDGFDVGFGTWSINDLAKVAEEGGDLPETGSYTATDVAATATISE